MSIVRGLYRDGIPGAEWAHVTDGDRGFKVPEPMYREQGYQPAFETLATKVEFERVVALTLMTGQGSGGGASA